MKKPSKNPKKSSSTPKRSSKKARTLVAGAIHLCDDKGNLRILLDAGRASDGHATISLFSNTGKIIQISTQPNGSIAVALHGGGGAPHAVLSMRADDRAGLQLSDDTGRLGTLLGAGFSRNTHSLTLFDKGQPYWKSPRPKGRAAKK